MMGLLSERERVLREIRSRGALMKMEGIPEEARVVFLEPDEWLVACDVAPLYCGVHIKKVLPRVTVKREQAEIVGGG